MSTNRRAARAIALMAATLAVSSLGCGPTVDVAAALRLESVTTGWVDAGPVGSTTRVVPVVSFAVKNTSDRTLAPVQVNAVFRRVGESSEWSNAMVVAAGSTGLAPSTSSDRLVIKEIGRA